MGNNKISSTTHQDSGMITSRKALVVEDDEVIEFVYRKFLERLGYQVGSVKNGEDALERTSEADYDVILLDVGLPGISGEFVLSAVRLRELSTRKHVLIIVNTAHWEGAKLKEYIEAGADAAFQKPLSFATLAQVLEKLVRNSASEKK